MAALERRPAVRSCCEPTGLNKVPKPEYIQDTTFELLRRALEQGTGRFYLCKPHARALAKAGRVADARVIALGLAENAEKQGESGWQRQALKLAEESRQLAEQAGQQ